MNNFTDLRQLLLAYKLGELPAEDRDQLDERIIVDRGFSDEFAEAAYDLLDDYRAGRLGRAQRRRVEKAFSQAELRSGLDLTFDRSKMTHPASGAMLRGLPLAVASLALASAGLLAFFIHLQKAPAPTPFAASHPAQSPGLRVPPATPIPPSGSGSSTATQSSSRSLAILLLHSSVARSGTSSVLELGPDTQVVRVQWVVPDDSIARAFTLSVAREGAILTTIAQRGNPHKVSGRLEADFDLAPGIFAKYPEDAHFLFIVSAGDQSHTAVGEYPVIVRARP